MTGSAENFVNRRQALRVGWILFLSVFVFYVLLAPPFAVPGRWAGIAAIFSGLDPFRPVMRPMWSGVTALLSLLPIGNIGWAFNLLTAAAGAASCWLLFEIVRRIPFSRTLTRMSRDREEAWPRLVAGLSAALFAAVSFEMIALSTRGDYVVFDMFLLLLALYPVVLFIERPRWGCVHASCAFMGFALVEYPTAALVLPGFLMWWGLLLWKAQLPRIAPYVLAGSLLLSGVVVLLFYTIIYDSSLAAIIRDLKNPGDILFSYLRLYFAELTRSVPRVGWLLIIGFNIVPFIAVMLRELDEPTDSYSAIGVYLLRAILVVLAVMSLFNLPGSPGHVIGRQAMLLAPVILVAVWSGYLLGYYAGIFGTAGRRMLARVVPAIWLVMLLAAGVRHGLAARVGQLEPVVAFAGSVVEQLNGRNFIITDGSLDPSLLLAARNAGIRVNIINIQTGTSSEHGRYYATMFDAPDFQALAMLGTSALLRDWLTREPGALGRTVLLASPELIRFSGIETLPDSYFYRLARRDDGYDAFADYKRLMPVWQSIALPVKERIKPGDAGWNQSEFVIRWTSRLANDLGFALDEIDRPELARFAYEQSLSMSPDNISAAFNKIEQDRRTPGADPDLIDEQIQSIAEKNPELTNLRYAHYFCGLLRNPTVALAQLSEQQPSDIDPARLDKIAQSLSQGDERTMVNIARLYLRGADPDESEQIYRTLLATNPENLDALYGLFQVSLIKRDLEKAGEYLDHMVALGVDENRLALDRAALAMATNDTAGARVIYEGLIRQSEAPNEAWLGLLQIGIREKNDNLIEASFAALERAHDYVPGQFMLGERALFQRNPPAARDYFLRIIALEPSHEAALVRLLQIAFGNKDAAAIRQHSATLLSLRPDHPFANYMSAFVHIDAGNYDLAEAALRRSVAVNEDGAALNELAYVIFRQQRYDEALAVAQRAVAKAPRNYNAWDTLAGIQSKLGLREDAIKSMEEAIKLNLEGDPFIYLHAAELFVDAGMRERAMEMQDSIDTALAGRKNNPELDLRLNQLNEKLSGLR